MPVGSYMTGTRFITIELYGMQTAAGTYTIVATSTQQQLVMLQ